MNPKNKKDDSTKKEEEVPSPEVRPELRKAPKELIPDLLVEPMPCDEDFEDVDKDPEASPSKKKKP